MIPQKLIVVGMRFIPKWDSLKVAKFDSVRLYYETNAQGSDGKAWGVYNLAGNRIGYVREVDKPLLSGYKNTPLAYSIKTINPNYMVLESTVQSNPCAEALMPRIDVNLTSTRTIDGIYPAFQSKPKERNIKMNTNSMRDSFFREIKNAVLDMTTGGFGIKTPEGIAVYKEGTVSINPIAEMGVPVPAFAMRVAVDTLTEGDIIINGTETTFFKGTTKDKEGYEVVSMSGEVKQVGNVSNMFFGKNTVLAIKNMVSGTGMNPMMMAMMFAGDEAGGKMDMKTLAMMSMMGGTAGKGMDQNMLMMMMFMGK